MVLVFNAVMSLSCSWMSIVFLLILVVLVLMRSSCCDIFAVFVSTCGAIAIASLILPMLALIVASALFAMVLASIAV